MSALSIERKLTGFIAGITMLTGASQMLMPAALLPLLGVQPTAAAAQLFATVGMFMLLFGGALLHAQRARTAPPPAGLRPGPPEGDRSPWGGPARTDALAVVLLWAALQKLGAAALVSWGVAGGVFAPLALAVAAFDAASGLLFLDLRRRGG